jgi:hypothetical protein
MIENDDHNILKPTIISNLSTHTSSVHLASSGCQPFALAQVSTRLNHEHRKEDKDSDRLLLLSLFDEDDLALVVMVIWSI